MLAILLGLGILFGCAAFVIALASGIGTGGLTANASRFGSGLITTIIVALLTIPVDVFTSAVWTLAFRRWQGKDGPAVAPSPVALPPTAVP